MSDNIVNTIHKGLEMTTSSEVHKLNELYNQIPKGDCTPGCANCCMESVETHYIEFLRILDYLVKTTAVAKVVLPKIVDFYFKELYIKSPCPFLNEEKRCSIYEVRPLPCRLYGSRDKEAYESSYQKFFEEGLESHKYLLKHFGVGISKEVLEYKVPFCEEYVLEKGKTMDEVEMVLLNDEIVTMQFPYFMEGLIDIHEIKKSLVLWFVELLIEKDEIDHYRIAVLKELQEKGESKILERLMSSFGSDDNERMENFFSALSTGR